jgi:hypothetical protein
MAAEASEAQVRTCEQWRDEALKGGARPLRMRVRPPSHASDAAATQTAASHT